jgi:hypothetical protein
MSADTKEFEKLLSEFKVAVGSEQSDPVEDQSELIRMFDDLLSKFKQLPEPEFDNFETFLEIAGVGDKENVASNILSFYLHPKGKHYFGDVLLQSLCHVAGISTSNNSFNKVEIKRERCTNDRKRIDIFVETEDFIIGIENKLFAGEYNPFDSYECCMKEKSGGKKKYYGILLSLDERCETKNKSIFKPITYNMLFETFNTFIAKRLLKVDNKYLLHFIDFILTIKHLTVGTYMDPKLLEYFTNNSDVAFRFYRKSQELVKVLQDKVEILKTVWCHSGFHKFKPWNCDGDVNSELFVAGVCSSANIENSHCIYVEAKLTLDGWTISFAEGDDTDPNVVKSFVDKSHIQYLEKIGNSCWIYFKSVFNENPSVVKNKLQELVDIIGYNVPVNIHIRSLIANIFNASLDFSESTFLRFAPKSWYSSPILKTGLKWTDSNMILLYETEFSTERVIVSLLIGPGPEGIRKNLFDLAFNNDTVFLKRGESLLTGENWTVIYCKVLWESPKDGNQDTQQNMLKRIDHEWESFLSVDYPALNKAIEIEIK